MAPPASRLIVHTTAPSSSGQHERGAAQADAIEQPADRQTDRRAEQRRPQIDVRVGDAIELQIAQHRLGDEPEALRPARQRRRA